MGANQQTSVPAFTAGQVLTAQQQTEINTGIPVFADSTARTAAFGGTGEKVLAEGQYSYLEDTNSTEVYDGSSWVEVGASGLVLISSTTIGSAVSSVTVSNAFSATYDNYLITLSGGASSTNTKLVLTFGATTTGYYYSAIGVSYGSTTVTATGANAANFDFAGYANTNGLIANLSVLSPNLTKNTFVGSSFGQNVTNGTNLAYGGFLNDTTAYTAFTLATGTGTLTGGTIRVYGYKN